MSDSLVYWSVAEANRQRGGRTVKIPPCHQCGHNEGRAMNGVDPQYASQHNPGEYVQWTCGQCGYSWDEQS